MLQSTGPQGVRHDLGTEQQPLLFHPQGAFLVVQSLSCVGLLGPHVSPLPQAWETYDLLILYSNEGYPLFTWHNCYLKVSVGDKTWLFTLL